MATAIRRLVPPIILLALGAAAVYYGARLNAKTVEVQEEMTVKIPAPPQPKIPGMSMFGGSPRPQPPAPPPRKEKVWVELVLSELDMVKDVTVGGLTLVRSGEDKGLIRRTYFGDMPSLCPT